MKPVVSFLFTHIKSSKNIKINAVNIVTFTSTQTVIVFKPASNFITVNMKLQSSV